MCTEPKGRGCSFRRVGGSSLPTCQMAPPQPATESQKPFVESCWKKAPKYAQGEMTQDGARSWAEWK